MIENALSRGSLARTSGILPVSAEVRRSRPISGRVVALPFRRSGGWRQGCRLAAAGPVEAVDAASRSRPIRGRSEALPFYRFAVLRRARRLAEIGSVASRRPQMRSCGVPCVPPPPPPRCVCDPQSDS